MVSRKKYKYIYICLILEVREKNELQRIVIDKGQVRINENICEKLKCKQNVAK